MFLRVVANVIPSRNFDGKIFLQRVSKEKVYAQTTCNQNSSDDASANGLLKNGEWKDENLGLIVNGMTLGNLKDALANQYQIGEDICERIVVRTHVGEKRKCEYVEKDDALIPTQDTLTIGDYTLMVKNRAGDVQEVDVSCDSEFMEKVMPKVGKAIRDSYHWVSLAIPICLYLNNT